MTLGCIRHNLRVNCSLLDVDLWISLNVTQIKKVSNDRKETDKNAKQTMIVDLDRNEDEIKASEVLECMKIYLSESCKFIGCHSVHPILLLGRRVLTQQSLLESMDPHYLIGRLTWPFRFDVCHGYSVCTNDVSLWILSLLQLDTLSCPRGNCVQIGKTRDVERNAYAEYIMMINTKYVTKNVWWLWKTSLVLVLSWSFTVMGHEQRLFLRHHIGAWGTKWGLCNHLTFWITSETNL